MKKQKNLLKALKKIFEAEEITLVSTIKSNKKK